MAFEGDLKHLPLADLLQNVHQNGLTGTLSLRDGDGPRRVAFEKGHIVACLPIERDAGRNVGDSIIQKRLVQRRELEAATTRFIGKRRSLREAIVGKRLLEEDKYVAAVRDFLSEQILDLFLIGPEGTFKIEEGELQLDDYDEAVVAEKLKLPPAGIVMEGVRRVDEWARIRHMVGSLGEVLVRDGKGEEKDTIQTEALELADGTRDLGTILAGLPVSRFKGYEAVAALVTSRRLRPITGNEYLNLGSDAERKGEFKRAAVLYERGLVTERGNLELRRRRASVLERAGDGEGATAEMKLLGAALLEQGRPKEADAAFAKASELAPRDPMPLERRLAIAREAGAQDEAREVADRLVALYETLGLGDKARETWRGLSQGLLRSDEAIRERLGDLLARQGDPAGAAKEWKGLARDALAKRDLVLAARRLRRATEIDPSDQDAKRQLHDIESGELVARRQRRRRYALFALFAALILGAAARAGWEGRALYDLDEAMRGSLGAVADGEASPESIDLALRRVVAVADEWPLTFASRRAQDTFGLLLEAYLAATSRAIPRELKLPDRPATAKPTPALNKLAEAIGEVLNPKGQPDLEAVLAKGDEQLGKDDTAAAHQYEAALARIRDARALFAAADDASRKEARTFLRLMVMKATHARLGRLKTFPLKPDQKSRVVAREGAILAQANGN